MGQPQSSIDSDIASFCPSETKESKSMVDYFNKPQLANQQLVTTIQKIPELAIKGSSLITQLRESSIVPQYDLEPYIISFRFNSALQKLKFDKIFKSITEKDVKIIERDFKINLLNSGKLTDINQLDHDDFSDRIRRFIALYLLKKTYNGFNPKMKSELKKSLKNKMSFEWKT